jgi:hypothetical protein
MFIRTQCLLDSVHWPVRLKLALSRSGGFYVLNIRQSDFDLVLGRGLDPQRDWANTEEDRTLAPRPCHVYRILYQDAAGLGGEVTWDGENAQVMAPR